LRRLLLGSLRRDRLNDMNVEEFESNLRRFLRQEPFYPFEVELIDGRRVEVNRPAVVFGGGAATFVTPDFDLIEFVCEDVRAIRQMTPEAAS
jgi:hypothetical protein